MRGRVGVVLCLAWGMACSDGLSVQSGFVQLSPPDALVDLSARYAELWSEIRQCSGAGGEYSELRFYWHPTEDTPITKDGKPIAALAKVSKREIWAGRASGKNPFIMRHEMLHIAISNAAHPPEYFDRRCNDLVSHGYKGG